MSVRQVRRHIVAREPHATVLTADRPKRDALGSYVTTRTPPVGTNDATTRSLLLPAAPTIDTLMRRYTQEPCVGLRPTGATSPRRPRGSRNAPLADLSVLDLTATGPTGIRRVPAVRLEPVARPRCVGKSVGRPQT